MSEEHKPRATLKGQEVLALAAQDPGQAERRWMALSRDQRLRAVLAAPAEEREKLINLASDAAELVRTMAPDEFAATVMALGPDDAGGLVAMSSDDQLTYLLDLTGWVKDGFAPERYAAWLPLVMEGGAARVVRWLAAADLEVLALLCASWFRVEKFLPSQEQQEPPDDLPEFSLDGVYFIAFSDQKTAAFVAQVLVLMHSERPGLYQSVMEAMLWESAALLAEDALRWRTGRLMDMGFPERLEALELWAHPLPGETDWAALAPKEGMGLHQSPPPRSDAAVGLLPAGEALPVAAGALGGEAADGLRAELAYIANCGVAALEADPAQPEQVARSARESLGLVNLGLSLVSQEEGVEPARVVERVAMAALARRGAAALKELNRRAWDLIRRGWLKDMPHTLHILEHPLDRRVAGMVFPRPRCYDPDLGQDREYRAFLSLADLELARRSLAQAEFWGVLLFERMGLGRQAVAGLISEAAWPEDGREIKTTHLIGTFLARRAMGLEGLAPIPAAELNQAAQALKQGLAGELGRELEGSLAALGDAGEAALAGQLLRGALARLEEELGRLDTRRELEPAFVGGLVLGE